ncbi:MAG TPA: hypothetical protein VMO17_21510 [Terriglobia bacterium]|nr:hypothetical protein [Terriglobia bacterium]
MADSRFKIVPTRVGVSLLLIPVYSFLRAAILMAAVNLAPAAMAAACSRKRGR